MSPEKKQQGSSISTEVRLAINGWAAFLTSATLIDVGGSDSGRTEKVQPTSLNTAPERHLNFNMVAPQLDNKDGSFIVQL